MTDKVHDIPSDHLKLSITRDGKLVAVQMEDKPHGLSLSMRLTPDKAEFAADLLRTSANTARMFGQNTNNDDQVDNE